MTVPEPVKWKIINQQKVQDQESIKCELARTVVTKAITILIQLILVRLECTCQVFTSDQDIDF